MRRDYTDRASGAGRLEAHGDGVGGGMQRAVSAMHGAEHFSSFSEIIAFICQECGECVTIDETVQ
jgi:hypothetical protein